MNAIAQIPLGQIIPVPNMRVPVQGAQSMPIVLRFSGQTTLEGDLAAAFSSGNFDFAQSVFIDNKNNSSTFTLKFPGAGPRGQDIQAQPYSQGYYPISPSVGDGRFVAIATDGEVIPVIFYNVPMPYFVWGPVDGVLVTPALVNANRVEAIAAPGNLQLVAGVGGQTIRLYRILLSVDSPTEIRFTDGPGGALIAPPASLTAGGSMMLQASGVPWGTTSLGNDLTMAFSAACNAFMGYGYVQD